MAFLLLPSLCALAQDTLVVAPNKEVLHSTMIGVGSANVLDTYLSPYNYKGTDYRIQRETQRMTQLWGGRVSNQSFIDRKLPPSHKNHARNIKEYAGGIRYSQGWFYNFMEWQHRQSRGAFQVTFQYCCRTGCIGLSGGGLYRPERQQPLHKPRPT